ncbi:MAG TPA: polysaccharide pyruvyl transferase family protein [Polyangiaceae bacterium]
MRLERDWRALKEIVAAAPKLERIAAGPSAPLRLLQTWARKRTAETRFILKHRKLRDQSKIIYALTPTPQLRNIGDHAQAVAIHRWFTKHFPGRPVIELDKTEVLRIAPFVRRFVTPDDLIFLHSGGNLGDRGIWSETGRRLMIETFPDNPIISLPQTIYFSDTEQGREQRRVSQEIYGRHRKLTVVGRDRVSGQLASELFPNARTFCMPDFVLSLPPRQARARNAQTRLLLCLRDDSESVLTPVARERLSTLLPYELELFDTSISGNISRSERAALVDRTLEFFGTFDATVTDRYHGVIFSVLSGLPTVVLPTVDHKLTSAVEWFEELPTVRLVKSIEDVPEALQVVMSARSEPLDWNARYFDRLLEMSGVAIGT